MTEQDLINAGYKSFQHSLNNSDIAYQKRFYNTDKKIKYYLNFYVYDFTKYPKIYVCDTAQISAQISAECELYTLNDWVTLRYNSAHEKDLEYIEQYFQDVYDVLDCEPDIYNN